MFYIYDLMKWVPFNSRIKGVYGTIFKVLVKECEVGRLYKLKIIAKEA